MKRAAALCLTLFLTLACAAALAMEAGTQAPTPADVLPLADALTGEHVWQADGVMESATLRYRYPQFDVWTDADKAINAYYQAMAQDMQNLTEPLDASIDFEVTHDSSRYVSVVLTSTTLGGGGENVSISADTFARDGLYAGQPVSLSQVLGLEEEGDELSDGQSVAEQLAYELIWRIVERDSQNADGDYLDGLTKEQLTGAFSPESDFYLDGDGNVVFFIQSGEIAGEIAGILHFPFAPAELLSAVKEL